MKALLISESDEILNSYAAFFKEAGYDTVCYRWLLKAMDNLEEIEPQLVFIDGFGYPRHWKTLAQYIKTSFKNAPLVLLAADLSEEEAKKADCLDVHCISGSIDDAQTRRNILSLLHPEQEQAAVFSQTPVAVDRLPEQAEVPAADPIQTAEFAEPEEELEVPVEDFEEPEPAEEESANPDPTTAPPLNDGDPVSAHAEELAECEATPAQPEVEPTEQSAFTAIVEPGQEPEVSAEPVEEIEEPEVPAADPIQTAEPAAFGELSEEESANPEPTTAPSLNDGDPVSTCAEELAECEVEPVQPVVEPAEQSAELIAATEPAEIAEPETFAPEPVERFEEPEQIDDEPFFAAPAQTSSIGGKSVSAVREEKSEADSLDERNGENEPEAALGDNEVFSFTFCHPLTKVAIHGSTVSFKPPLLYFKPDDSSVLRTLRFGQKSSGVINDKGLASDVSVQIQGFENDSIELCLLK